MATPNRPDAQSAVRTALIARAVDLGLTSETVRCPPLHAGTARRRVGNLFASGSAISPATEVSW